MQGQTSSYVTTTLVTAPASAALASLDTVRDELDFKEDETDENERLTRFINEESAGIARYCNRIFGLATWQDQFRLTGGIWGEGVRAANNPLKLTRFPLVGPPVVFTGNTHSNRMIDGISSTTGLAVGQSVFGAVPSGTTIAAVTPYAVMLSANATSTAAGVQFTAGMSVVETVATVDYTRAYGTDYEVETGSMLPGDEGPARVYRLNERGNPKTWHGQKVVIIYQAGYALPDDDNLQGVRSLPDDLEAACVQMVVTRYRMKGRDRTLMQRGQGEVVGSERYWVGGQPGQKGAYPPDIMDVLDRYRTPVMA